MDKKKIYFQIVLVLPSLFLLALMVATADDLRVIRNIRPADIDRALRDHNAGEQPESLPLPSDIHHVDASRKTVFAFGESSLVLSDGETFPYYLQENHPGLRVVNFGVSGLDSISIRQRVAEALRMRRPDIIVLYYGHNDYNNAFHEFIIPAFFDRFNVLLGLLYPFHNGQRPAGVLLHNGFYWFSRLTRPRLLHLFERLGMFDIRAEDYAPINRIILDYYVQHTSDILAMAESLKVPVVLITPVGNLHAEPFGDYHVTSSLYRQGMAEKDYLKSLSLLKSARDAEIFTYDLRAKSPLLDYIRSVRRPGVYVLDLEKTLEDMRFGFGYGEFLDYFHFSDRTHRLLADTIYSFMQTEGLLNEEGGTKAVRRGQR